MWLASPDSTALEAYTDWIYVDNLVHALLLAAEGSVAGDKNICGNAFHVSDGTLSTNTELFTRVAEEMGFERPGMSLSQATVLGIAYVFMFLSRISNFWIKPQASPMEMIKICKPNWFR